MATDAANWLNRIIELLHDSHDGYKECADTVNDSFLKRLFSNLAELRQTMIRELEAQAREMQVTPEKTGSTLAAAHRLFVDLKGMLTNGEPKAIVEEIKRGEKYTIDHYQQALNEDLPTYLKDILRRQLAEIQGNLSQVTWRTEEPA